MKHGKTDTNANLRVGSGQQIDTFSNTVDNSANSVPTGQAVRAVTDKNELNIVLNAFRIAVNGSLTQFNMIDGIVDEYEDESGINTGTSTNEGYDSVNDLYSPSADPAIKLLVSFDGLDAATSATDASPSNHSLVFNGAAELDTTIKKFGTASLNLPNPSGDYVSIIDSPDWDVFASNSEDWTIDMWIYNNDSLTNPYIISHGDGTNNNRWAIHNPGDGTNSRINFRQVVSGVNDVANGLTNLTDGEWNHIACVKLQDEMAIYVNGELSGYQVVTQVGGHTGTLKIGSRQTATGNWDGQIDDLRIIKSNAFSAVPQPVPESQWKLNDGNVGTNVVNSGINKTLPGTASANTNTLTTQSKVRNGKFDGACYFDGVTAPNGSMLTIPDSADWNFGSGDFTIDFWANLYNVNTLSAFCSQWFDNNNRFRFFYNSSVPQIRVQFVGSGIEEANYDFDATAIIANTWHHIALVRNGTSLLLFIDGVSQSINTITTAIGSNTLPDINSLFRIGVDGDSNLYSYSGLMDEFRVSKGLARWTSDFSGSLPSSAYTSDANTQLLLHFDGNFTDSGNTGHTVTSEAGLGAFDFNGSSDYINLDNIVTSYQGDTTGTVMAWVKPTVVGGGAIFSLGDTDANTDIYFYQGSGGMAINADLAGANVMGIAASGSAPTVGVWNHVAYVQDGTLIKFYLNGVLQTLTTSVGTDKWFADVSTGLDTGRIGSLNYSSGGEQFFYNGSIDDVRYYQNRALTSSQISYIYNSGNGRETFGAPITVPTSAHTAPKLDMALVSNANTAEAQPDSARIVLFEEDVDSITLNTDLKAFASRDGGTTFSQITLVNEGQYEAGKNILAASVDISGQPAGTSMVYKIETLNNKDLKIHGTGLSWD